MSTLDRRIRVAMFLRSFVIQASFNYRTLIGTGFAFVLLPALVRIFAGRPHALADAVHRHEQIFNSHPYLAGVALGAVARLEAEGATPGTVEKFKTAVRGSLGTLGDVLFWAGWRPFCALAALLLYFEGAPIWIPVVCFLLLFNTGHLLARAWSFRVGLRYGTGVAERLRRARLQDLQRFIAGAGAFMIGLLLPLSVGQYTQGMTRALPWLLAIAAAAAIGLRFGAAARTPVALALAAFAVVALLWGWLS